MSPVDLQRFKQYLRGRLQEETVKDALEGMVKAGGEFAGQNREEIFTKKFLCPRIRGFLCEHVRSELNLTAEEIYGGLGAEGFEKIPSFCFTPARKNKHLFTKSEVINSLPPRAWLRADQGVLPNYQACPDFAVRKPMPFAVVGEVKYFKSGSPEKAVTELYNASRQALFYLAAFHNVYESALLVFVDASRGESFFRGLDLIKPALLDRFGTETDIHLLPIRII